MPEKFNFPRPQPESLVKYFLSQVRPDMWRWIRSQPLIFCEGVFYGKSMSVQRVTFQGFQKMKKHKNP